MQKNVSEIWLEENIGKVLLVIFGIALLSIGLVLIKYNSQFSGATLSDHDKWGQFGDYVGGTLNPLLSFLALMAVLVTLFVQSRAMSINRNQAAQQTKVASHTAQIAAIDTLIQSLNEQIEQYQSLIGAGGSNVTQYQKMLDRRDTLLVRLDKVYEDLVALETVS